MQTLGRWLAILLLVAVGGGVGWWWQSARAATAAAEVASHHDAELVALRAAAEGWSQTLAAEHPEVALRAFAAGIYPVLLLDRRDLLPIALEALLELPGVEAVHLLSPNGAVLAARDRNPSLQEAHRRRARWALGTQQLSSRPGERAEVTELAAPVKSSRGTEALVWLAFDAAARREGCRPPALAPTPPPTAVAAPQGSTHQPELVAPADGERWAAGGEAWLEWQNTAGLASGAHEWEAFLSLDGGATFPVRLTPHLPLATRRVRVPVPAVAVLAGTDVRVLLRVGDGREERPYEFARRLIITPPAVALDFTPQATQRSRRAGEAARPGDRGVAYWTEERNGRWVKVAAERPLHWRPTIQPSAWFELLLPPTRSEDDVLPPPAAAAAAANPRSRPSWFPSLAAFAPAGRSLLNRLHRANE